MNINTRFPNNYAISYRKYGQNQNVSFNGYIKGKNRVKTLKSFVPFVLAGTFFIGNLSMCSTSRYSGKDSYKGFDVEYYNVKNDTKNELISAYQEFKSKLTPKNDFLEGVNLILTDERSSLDDDNSFKSFLKKNKTFAHTGGMSFYSDDMVQRNIAINEKAHNFNDEFYNLITTGEKTIAPQLRHSLMHEVGHQFDEYFGHDHSEKFALDFDSVMFLKERNPNENPYAYRCKSEKEYSIVKFYNDNNTLSDKDEFKQAILEDLKNVVRIKNSPYEFLPTNINYFTQGIDLTKEITLKDIDNTDRARSEVYANLFSYAVGENDGDKTNFINAFSNSFEVVKNDVKTYLGNEFVK